VWWVARPGRSPIVVHTSSWMFVVTGATAGVENALLSPLAFPSDERA
jgi:hypothetical protein